MREVLRTGVVVCTGELEQLDRQRLGALDLAERDEHLADADERARLASAVGEAAAEGETLLECGECALLVAHVVDQQPAERIQSVRSSSSSPSALQVSIASASRACPGSTSPSRAASWPAADERTRARARRTLDPRAQPRSVAVPRRGARARARTSRARPRVAAPPRRLRPPSASRAKRARRRDRARVEPPTRIRAPGDRRTPPLRERRSSSHVGARRRLTSSASASRSAASSRMVSSRRKRSAPIDLSKLASTSVASASSSASHTSSAASSEKPPAKTDSRAKQPAALLVEQVVAPRDRRRAGSGAGRAASRAPPVSSGSARSSRSSSFSGVSSLVRAAASSIASGRPSRRRQIASTVASGVELAPDRLCPLDEEGRRVGRRRAGRAGTRARRSIRSGLRLVARTRSPPRRQRSSLTARTQRRARCSKLSRSSRRSLPCEEVAQAVPGAEGLGDLRLDELRVGDGCERNPEHTVAEAARRAPRRPGARTASSPSRPGRSR